MKEAPAYDPTVDYYKEFWRLYLQNENLVCDIDMTASQNYRLSRKIFNIKDFYENTLVPQIFTQPHKFLHRLRQQQRQAKLQQDAKERQARLNQQIEQAQKIKEEGEALLREQNDAKNKRKKHMRRTANEIDRAFICPYEGCSKFFGSEGS